MRTKNTLITHILFAAVLTLSSATVYAAERGGEELDPSDGTPAAKQNAIDERAADIANRQKKSSSKIVDYIHDSLKADDSLSDDAKNVDAKASGRTITLTGTVDSIVEKNKVESVAKELAVNRTVQSNLKVKQ